MPRQPKKKSWYKPKKLKTYSITKPAPSTLVITRQVKKVNQKTRWGKPRLWVERDRLTDNIKEAILYARALLDKKQVGCVVYIVIKGGTDLVPIYHTKWGVGKGGVGVPFAGWKSNPIADYWRKKL